MALPVSIVWLCRTSTAMNDGLTFPYSVHRLIQLLPNGVGWTFFVANHAAFTVVVVDVWKIFRVQGIAASGQ